MHNSAEVFLVSQQVPSLFLTDSLATAALCLVSQKKQYVAVVDADEHPLGLISAMDLLGFLAQGCSPNAPLSQYLHQVPSLPEEAGWQDFMAEFAKEDSSEILLLHDHDGKLAGILTEGDFCHCLGMSYLSGAQFLLNSLRDSEMKLKAIFDSTCVFLGLLSLEGNVIDVNHYALSSIGVHDTEVLGQPFWQTPWFANNPLLQENVRAAVLRATRGESSLVESRLSRQGLTLEFGIRPVRDNRGEICYLLPEGRDITAFRKAETALLSERAILQTVLNTIPDLVFYKDVDSVYLGCNKAFEKYFGRPQSQIVGRTDFYFVNEETANMFRERDRIAMQSGDSQVNEEWVVYPDGHRVLLETLKTPIRGERNQVAGLLGISRDITHTRQAEMALRASDARYRLLFEHMTSGFALHEIILDIAGKPVDYRFLQVNPAFEQSVGLSAVQLEGHTVREVLPDLEENWIDLYGDVALTGRAVSAESFAAPLQRWYSVHAFSPQRGQFATIVNDVTERRLAEAALRQQKAQLRAILDNFPFMVWLKDKEGHFLAVNYEMARVGGFKNPEDMAGRSESEFWPPDVVARGRIDDLAVMNTLEKRVKEEPVGDSGFWVETFRTPILDDSGALLGTAGFSRDITDRKQAEEALQASQAHYQALLAISPVAVVELDILGACVYVNQKYTEITGYGIESVLGDGWMQGVHAEDLPKLIEVKNRCFGFAEPGMLEYRHLRPDGKEVWVIGQGMPMQTIQGEVSGLIVTLTDISERKTMENSLRLAASMYEASGEGILVVDADNRIVSVNNAFSTLMGYRPAEVLGRDPSELHSERNPSALRKDLWDTVREQGYWQGEIWNQHKDGRDIALWMTVNTLRNRNGEVQWRFALFSDITERKNSEELIWRQANYDVLTGLPNRRLFRDRLQLDIKKAQRTDNRLALLFIDLDHFKEVNDSLGHDCGDLLLVEAGERISRCVREYDTVARLGGDEFTVVLTDLQHDERASDVALAIIQVLVSPFMIEGNEAHVSASIGIAFYPQDGQTDQELLKQADRAMYFAKAKGRNCFATVSG